MRPFHEICISANIIGQRDLMGLSAHMVRPDVFAWARGSWPRAAGRFSAETAPRWRGKGARSAPE